ncbi:rod shape-determining protein MreD [bacterium]|nr:MAG: rod shape-determining protein MreD [bacterium]
MREFLRTTALWVAVAFIGDTAVGPAIAIRGVSPDFSMIALVLLALAAGPLPATLGGFVLGLVQDISNPGLLGLNALCKSSLGSGLGRLRGHLVYGLPVVDGLVVLLAVLLHDIVFLLFQSRLSDDAFLMPLVTQTLPVAVYSGIIGMIVIRLANMLGVFAREE